MLPLPVVLAALAVAQPPVTGLWAGPPGPTPPPAPRTRSFTASPAAEPRPALRYVLLPPLGHDQPGNAADSYYRAFLLRPKPPTDPAAALARSNEQDEWLTVPLDKLPRAAVRARLGEYQQTLRELEWATARRRCDWDLLARMRKDGITVVLPEAQYARELARLLALRTRLELAEDRFDDAARSLQAGFQMARHTGEAPTLIQLLVGLAVEANMMERVEDWIARPGSPNLYWALSALPRPLIDPRPGFEGEAVFLETYFPSLTKLRAGPLPAAEAAAMADRFIAEMRRASDPQNIGGPEPKGGPEARLAHAAEKIGAVVYVVTQYPAAKKGLLARGRAAAEVDAMPGAQVVFLNTIERFLELRDEQWKWLGMPYHLARPAMREAEQRVKAAGLRESGTDPYLTMFTLVLPASETVIAASARTERRVAFLRAVEAVRMYAAAHGGTPPATLADVTAVPVPDDPYFAKPFGYEAKGATAVFTAAPPDGEAPNERNALRYEVTFRTAAK